MVSLTPYLLNQEAEGAEIKHFYKEQLNCTATAHNNFLDRVVIDDVTDIDFIINRKYLIVAQAQFAGEGNNDNGYWRVTHGTAANGGTSFPSSELVQEYAASSGTACSVNTDLHTYFWFTIWNPTTADEATHDIRLQEHSGDNSDTMIRDTMSIFVMEISEDLTENTDWFYDEGGADTTLGTAWNTDDDASITFTPTAGDDWLIMATARLDPANTGKQFETRIRIDDTFLDKWSQEGEDTTLDRMVQTLVRVQNLDGTSHTIQTESQVESGGGGSGERTSSAIFALNLDKFETQNSFFEVTSEDVPNNGIEVYPEPTSFAINPTTAGDFWIMSSHSADADGIYDSQMRVDGQSIAGLVRYNAQWDVTDELGWLMQTVENLSTGAKQIDIFMRDGANNVEVEDKNVFAVSMELVAAGGHDPISATDTWTFVSSTSEIKHFLRSGTDVWTFVETTNIIGHFLANGVDTWTFVETTDIVEHFIESGVDTWTFIETTDVVPTRTGNDIWTFVETTDVVSDANGIDVWTFVETTNVVQNRNEINIWTFIETTNVVPVKTGTDVWIFIETIDVTGMFERSGTDTWTFIETTDVTGMFERSGTDTWTFIETTDVTGMFERSGTDTWTFVETSNLDGFTKLTSDVWIFVETVDITGMFDRSGVDIWTFVESTDVIKHSIESGFDTWTFVETGEVMFMISGTDTWTFVETTDVERHLIINVNDIWTFIETTEEDSGQYTPTGKYIWIICSFASSDTQGCIYASVCPAGQFVTGVDENGNLLCATP